MPEYLVQHAYRSARDGAEFGPWKAGEIVELTDADAEWLNRDSPGVVAVPKPAAPAVELEPAPKPEADELVESVERQQPPVRDRQARGGRNRGA